MARHRVLIVEDEQDIAGLIKHTLERGGETEARDRRRGDAALKAVAERAPDLIILDLNLPVLSGLEVCRILRSRADMPHVPIIMLTARTSENDRVSGLELGADDYVTKPFSLRELTARVRAVLRRGPSADQRRLGSYRGDRLVADFEAVAIAVDGDADPAHAARVRAAAVSRPEQEPRRLARPAARARLGLRAAGRNAVGRRPRRPAAQQAARRRPSDRDRRRPRLPVRRLIATRHPPGCRVRLTLVPLHGRQEDCDGRSGSKLQEARASAAPVPFLRAPGVARQPGERRLASLERAEPAFHVSGDLRAGPADGGADVAHPGADAFRTA